MLIAAGTDSLWVLAAERVAPTLRGRGLLGRGMTAAVFVALGVYAAWPR